MSCWHGMFGGCAGKGPVRRITRRGTEILREAMG
jgi:hypothetical protein